MAKKSLINDGWHPVEGEMPPLNALLLYYTEGPNYIFGCGKDIAKTKEDYPAITHWKILTDEPQVL
jgi:hypothetical protein